MKPSFTRFVIAAAFAFSATSAFALSEDDRSMSSSSAAAKFSDPDEQTPSAVNLQGSNNASAGGVDQSSVRYDYDPASGSYVPHKN